MARQITQFEPRVLLCEPEYELRHIYTKHFERLQIPVLGIDSYQEIFTQTNQAQPTVIVISLYGTADGVVKFLERVAKTYAQASVVILTHNTALPSEYLLGTTVTQHIDKHQTSPKTLVSSIANLLSFSH